MINLFESNNENLSFLLDQMGSDVYEDKKYIVISEVIQNATANIKVS